MTAAAPRRRVCREEWLEAAQGARLPAIWDPLLKTFDAHGRQARPAGKRVLGRAAGVPPKTAYNAVRRMALAGYLTYSGYHATPLPGGCSAPLRFLSLPLTADELALPGDPFDQEAWAADDAAAMEALARAGMAFPHE